MVLNIYLTFGSQKIGKEKRRIKNVLTEHLKLKKAIKEIPYKDINVMHFTFFLEHFFKIAPKDSIRYNNLEYSLFASKKDVIRLLDKDIQLYKKLWKSIRNKKILFIRFFLRFDIFLKSYTYNEGFKKELKEKLKWNIIVLTLASLR